MITLAIVALVCATVLASLVLVLRHLAAMRASAGEVAELRSQWREGSAAIASAQTTLDGKLNALQDKFVNFQNRTQQR